MPYFKGEAVSDDWLQGELRKYRQANPGADTSDQPVLDVMEGKAQPTWGSAQTQQATSAGPSSNPQQQGKLDSLLEQMIANQKQYAGEAAARDKSQRDWSDQWRGNIMDQYKKMAQPVDEANPRIAHQAQTYDAAQQRALQMAKEGMAARQSQQKMPTGSQDAWLQGSYENLGVNNANYRAGLVGNEYQNQQDQIGKLLGLGAGVLTSDENRMLQDRQGTIGASLNNLGQQNQYGLGQQNMGFNYAQLGQQNQQYYDQMGYDIGLREAMMNNEIMRQLLPSG